MKNAIKQIYLLLAALSLTIILADCVIIDTLFVHSHFATQTECADLSSSFEYSHSESFEDDFFTTDSNNCSNTSLNKLELFPCLNLNFKDNYNPFIWQPPRFR